MRLDCARQLHPPIARLIIYGLKFLSGAWIGRRVGHVVLSTRAPKPAFRYFAQCDELEATEDDPRRHCALRSSQSSPHAPFLKCGLVSLHALRGTLAQMTVILAFFA